MLLKKESLKGALEDLEKNAEAAINANNKNFRQR